MTIPETPDELLEWADSYSEKLARWQSVRGLSDETTREMKDIEAIALTASAMERAKAAESALAASRAENARLREALVEIEWCNDSKWQSDRARAALLPTAEAGDADFDPARDPCNWPENIR